MFVAFVQLPYLLRMLASGLLRKGVEYVICDIHAGSYADGWFFIYEQEVVAARIRVAIYL